jgi:hypothetical protein
VKISAMNVNEEGMSIYKEKLKNGRQRVEIPPSGYFTRLLLPYFISSYIFGFLVPDFSIVRYLAIIGLATLISLIFSQLSKIKK